jgi:tRNA-guanine family transglycosylase
MRWDELTGQVLATLHNLRFYLDFMAEVRESIRIGTLAQLRAELPSRLEIQPDSDRRAEPEPVGPAVDP